MTKRIIGLAVALATTMALFGAAPAQATGVSKFTLNVVHGIPGLTVDVCVNGAKAITDFEPGDVVSGVKLPERRVPAEGHPGRRAVQRRRAVGRRRPGRRWQSQLHGGREPRRPRHAEPGAVPQQHPQDRGRRGRVWSCATRPTLLR